MTDDFVQIREGRSEDAPRLATLFRQSWELTYRGIIPHAHLECMISRRGTEWWTSSLAAPEPPLVLDAGGVIAGYATCGMARLPGPYRGEIYELYLEPVYQGLGFGERLFEAARYRLDMRRLRGLIVWALEENEAARRFYLRRGGRPVARAVERFGHARVPKVAFGWE